MDPADLERLVDRDLKRLPLPRAPRTLLPRVLAAVQEIEQRPWYTRAWFTWPVGWQLASAALLMATIAGLALLLPTLQAAASALSFVAGVRGDVADTTRDVETATTAVRVLWNTLLAPVVPYAFGLVLLMCTACAIFGAALNHLVFGKALR
jgi:hypothetical protein